MTTFAFDTQANGKGKPAAVTRTGVTEHTWTYDAQGRPRVETRTVDGVAYPFTTTYVVNSSQLASVQFPVSPHYPAGLTLSYTYTTSGYLKSVQSVAANVNPVTTYWQASAQDAEGHLAAFALGDGINTQRGYNPYTGLLTTLNSSSNNFATKLPSCPFNRCATK
ncbi:MAG: hypothetical protein HYX63_04265 [Gammaproteobacteria bacterium]|nr:hypothetical protein [Gammaproteobacteria bacterium]